MDKKLGHNQKTQLETFSINKYQEQRPFKQDAFAKNYGVYTCEAIGNLIFKPTLSKIKEDALNDYRVSFWIRMNTARPVGTGKVRWLKEERIIGVYSVHNQGIYLACSRLEKWDTILVRGFPEPRIDKNCKTGIQHYICADTIKLITRQYTAQELEQQDFLAMYQTEEQKKFYEGFVKRSKDEELKSILEEI